ISRNCAANSSGSSASTAARNRWKRSSFAESAMIRGKRVGRPWTARQKPQLAEVPAELANCGVIRVELCAFHQVHYRDSALRCRRVFKLLRADERTELLVNSAAQLRIDWLG